MAKEFKEKESKTDIAYRIMQKKKKERNFYDLWEDVKKELASTLTEEELANVEDEISYFYTDLTLDGRFVNIEDNKWNLRERVLSKDLKEDKNYVYADDDEDDDNNYNDSDESEDDGTSFDDDFEDSYDDSTGTDADIRHYHDQASKDDEEEE